MRQYVNLANLLTTGSLAAGFVALVLAGDGRLGAAFAAVAVAAVLDSIDGHVARRADVTGPFGGQLDSLADLVAFGVAPALMLHESGLAAVPALGIGASVAFVVAGAWRLARFAVVKDSQRFVGLPIPPAGLIAAAAALLALPGEAALALCLLLALLMISTVPFPTLVGLGGLSRRRPHVALRLVGGHGGADGARARQRARAQRHDDDRDGEAYEDERVRAPALARK